MIELRIISATLEVMELIFAVLSVSLDGEPQTLV